MLKKAIFVCLFSCIYSLSFAHFNEVWKDITPYGKHIYYENDREKGIEYLGDSINISQVLKWYFYKGYTIGENEIDSLGNSFFASDEIHNQIYQFKNEQTWKQFLNRNSLQPNYIRWHTSYWSMFPSEDNIDLDLLETYIILAILLAIIVIILIITLFINIIAYFLKEVESPFNIFMFFLKLIWQIIWKSTIFSGLPIFIISYLLGAFPQSF